VFKKEKCNRTLIGKHLCESFLIQAGVTQGDVLPPVLFNFAIEFNEIKSAKRSSENVSQYKYLETTVPKHNSGQEEIKLRLNSGNACYYSVQTSLTSRLLSKIVINSIIQDCNVACGSIRGRNIF
jgi:hypothetical protein